VFDFLPVYLAAVNRTGDQTQLTGPERFTFYVSAARAVFFEVSAVAAVKTAGGSQSYFISHFYSFFIFTPSP